ncbi:MAG: MW1434 family type I TA system toxin, partial [Candidatus Methanomethylophilaceae archaeon]
ARKGWNGKGIYIGLQNPDEHSANTLPYIYMVTDKLISDNPDAPRGRVPWLASQSDILTDDDWIEVAPTPFGLNTIDSGICSNIEKEFKEYKYESPVCHGVADTLKVNEDLYIDHMEDCTYCIRTMDPRTYIAEEDALRIAEFLRAGITEAVMWDVAKRKAKEGSPKCKFDNQPNPKEDLVHNPAHYTEGRKYDPWDVFIDWKLDYLTATATGYIARAGRKQYAGMTMKQSEETDLMKAIECLEKKLSVMREAD